MKDLCSRDLDTLIILQTPPATPDGMGGVTGGWDNAFELWAKVEPGSGRESEEARRQESRVTHKFYVRAVADIKITNAMRVALDDFQGTRKYYNIRAVIDVDFKHMFFRLDAEEGAET